MSRTDMMLYDEVIVGVGNELLGDTNQFQVTSYEKL